MSQSWGWLQGWEGATNGITVLKGLGFGQSNSGICLKASLSKTSIVDYCNSYLNSETVDLWGMAESFAVYLKLSPHCYSALFQYKIKSFLKVDYWALQRNLPLCIIIAKLLGWPKASFGFFIISYGKHWKNFLANPVFPWRQSNEWHYCKMKPSCGSHISVVLTTRKLPCFIF